MEEVPTVLIEGLSEEDERQLIIRDNINNGDWDWETLANEWDDLPLDEWGLILPSFEMPEEAEAGVTEDEKAVEEVINKATELQKKWNTATGQIWKLGNHRVMCGDSTNAEDVARLMDGNKAQLLHADPPYGMGKEKDGVANDNLYREKLDEFQMAWWLVWRDFIKDNASGYIWGNAPDLWRLWYKGGLADSEHLELRNELVWDKKNTPGMKSHLMTQYPEASERCLFFQRGQQFLGAVNKDDFPSSWLPLQSYFAEQAKQAKITSKDVTRICGVQMYGHWFTQSQYTLMPRKYYEQMGAAFPSFFNKEWKQLKAEWDRVKGGPTSEVQGARSYFDNSHDSMVDVWEFPRVVGDERWSHATPKPLPMMERVMKSSCPLDGIVVEPFGGSGSTLMGCETTGRKCYTMELSPEYVAVIIERWAMHTGKTPELIEE
jgi:DNA modification methylase